jgi:RNA polymerase sigma-70 factor (ECF subfamily)
MYNAAFRILGNTQEAEEVVQDTFIKVLQNLDKFRNQASFAAWMFRIAHNLCIDTVRSRQRKGRLQAMSFDPQSTQDQDDAIEVQLGVVSQIADPEPGPAQRVDRNEQQEIIAASLGQLPESQRAVIVLHDIEGFSYQEIADIVGTNVGTVRSRLHYGRLKLREMLASYFQNSTIASYPR